VGRDLVREVQSPCGYCGHPVEQPGGSRRRRRYCDRSCRQREYELRRAEVRREADVGGDAVWAGPPSTPVHACAAHRDTTLALLTGRYPHARWHRYAEPGRPGAGVVDDDQAADDQVDDETGVDERDAGYVLLFSQVDGWELYGPDDEYVASHDGFDEDHVDQAREWAARSCSPRNAGRGSPVGRLGRLGSTRPARSTPRSSTRTGSGLSAARRRRGPLLRKRVSGPASIGPAAPTPAVACADRPLTDHSGACSVSGRERDRRRDR
jgi:hypothetical protein